MSDEAVLDAIAELRKGSRTSISLVLLGVIFLGATVLYSATRLRPLEEQIQAKKDEIVQLEARRAELARIVAAAEGVARPAAPSVTPQVGWVYLGRVSSDGSWAPQSDRVKSSTVPSGVARNGLLEVQQNTSLVDELDLDSKETPSSASAGSTITPSLFIRPGTRLKIVDVKQQGSIGDGKLLWAKVQVPSDALLQIGQ